jgi:hypothetical protein
MTVRMKWRGSLACAALLLAASTAGAQEPPPKIGPYVVDLHGTFMKFPANQTLADSRGLNLAELPGASFGGDIGLHLYVFRWKAITFGVGGEVIGVRAHNVPSPAPGTTVALQAVTEKFLSAAPQLSFNFGSKSGWSYISGGVGLSQWSLIPDGAIPQDADTERLQTVNYGGGARWFIKRHLAFSFDVRIWQVKAGTPPPLGGPGSPRTSLMAISSGVSVR